jgi:hypothetical protein
MALDPANNRLPTSWAGKPLPAQRQTLSIALVRKHLSGASNDDVVNLRRLIDGK